MFSFLSGIGNSQWGPGLENRQFNYPGAKEKQSSQEHATNIRNATAAGESAFFVGVIIDLESSPVAACGRQLIAAVYIQTQQQYRAELLGY